MMRPAFRKKLSFYVLFATLCLSTFCSNSVQRQDRKVELGIESAGKKPFSAKEFVAATANPFASFAASKILDKGGSAVDAAIAAQMVLTLVEPQSSGIGGGAFILYWDSEKRTVSTIDARETAPEKATPDLFLNSSGTPAKLQDALVGGNSVGIPGVLHGLKLAHSKWGKLPWEDLFRDAIELSETGFPVSARLAELLRSESARSIRLLEAAREYFYPNGNPLEEGFLLKNKVLAATLRRLAQEGITPFYRGEIGDHIVSAVRNSPINPGRISKSDLIGYEAIAREPIRGTYRGLKIYGMGPPSSGGIAVQQILDLLEPFDLAGEGPTSPLALHLFSQASRLAFADRNLFLADTDFTYVPVRALLDEDYLSQRSTLIKTSQDMGEAKPGRIPRQKGQVASLSREAAGTSHLSIVDRYGNAVAMTTTIESGFGSGLFVDGFLLNNQLTDFSLDPKSDGKWVANRVEGGKRPRSSMAPTFVFDQEDNLKLILGSPGGSRIIDYVALSLICVIDWRLDIQAAITYPRLTNGNDYTAIEENTWLAGLEGDFNAMGHETRVIEMGSGLQGIQIEGEFLYGGADPRREGLAVGR